MTLWYQGFRGSGGLFPLGVVIGGFGLKFGLLGEINAFFPLSMCYSKKVVMV